MSLVSVLRQHKGEEDERTVNTIVESKEYDKACDRNPNWLLPLDFEIKAQSPQ